MRTICMNSIALVEPGSTVELGVFRGGRSRRARPRSPNAKKTSGAGKGGDGSSAGGEVGGLGMDAADLSEEIRGS